MDAALLFDPFDVGSTASTLARMASDESCGVICSNGDADELGTLIGNVPPRSTEPSTNMPLVVAAPRRIAPSSSGTGCETPGEGFSWSSSVAGLRAPLGFETGKRSTRQFAAWLARSPKRFWPRHSALRRLFTNPGMFIT